MPMKVSMNLQTSLLQTLTPQQIQYLKLLQLPILQLEQHVRQEVEQNPMLDESSDDMIAIEDDTDFTPTENLLSTVPKDVMDGNDHSDHSYDYDEPVPFEAEHHDPFDFYESAWNETQTPEQGSGDYDDEDDFWGNDQSEVRTFTDDLIEQINVLNLTDQEKLLCYTIIGNLEDDGYLRRSLEDLVDDVNSRIMEENHKQHRDYLRRHKRFLEESLRKNSYSSSYFDNLDDDDTHLSMEEPVPPIPVPNVTLEMAEKALRAVQQQDPPGIAARDLRECLLLQLNAKQNPNASELLAKRILEKSYDVFVMKHYTVLCRQFSINEDELKAAIDAIRRLNPKPGGMGISIATSTVIPDFVISIDDEDDIFINVNDTRIPQLKLNKMYEDLKKEARYRKYNKETKEWLRKKYDDAKFLLQAIRQRKKTMLKVMTGIAGAQKDFFRFGESALKPLIYKDVADVTGMDVSTICRIVNGKYVQTNFGTYELRFFFSESLPSDDGEEISTTVIKQKIKDLIEKEPKLKPHSDDKLMSELKKQGLNVARRTVAKYREQMRIPVARLRKEL
jgi:RNA polymerase sigma-54 factor